MITIYLDIMLGSYFYCQLPYKFCPAFVIQEKELVEYVEQQRPTLKGKDYRIIPTMQRV